MTAITVTPADLSSAYWACRQVQDDAQHAAAWHVLPQTGRHGYTAANQTLAAEAAAVARAARLEAAALAREARALESGQ